MGKVKLPSWAITGENDQIKKKKVNLPLWAKEYTPTKRAEIKYTNVNSNGQRAEDVGSYTPPTTNNLTPLSDTTTTTQPQNKSAWSKWVSQYNNQLNETGNGNAPKALKNIGTGLGFVLDYLPHNVGLLKPFQRAVNTASETMVGKGNLIDYKGNKIADVNKNLGTNKVVDTIADMGGNLLGNALMPVNTSGTSNLLNMSDDISQMAANKLTRGIGNNALRGYTNVALRGGIDNGIGNIVDSIRFGQNAKDTAQNGLQGALGGAAFFMGGKALNQGLNALPKWANKLNAPTNDLKPLQSDLNNLNNNSKGSNLNPLKTDLNGAKSLNLVPSSKKYTIGNKPFSNTLNKYDNAVQDIQNMYGHYKLTPEEIQTGADKLGIDLNGIMDRMKQAEGLKPIDIINNAAESGNLRRVALGEDLPKITKANNLNPLETKVPKVENNLQTPLKNRQFIENSVQNSEVAPKEMKSTIEKQPYIQIHNKDTWNKAIDKVNNNPQSALNEYFSQNSLKSADDTALAQALIVKAIKEGRIGNANELSIDLAERLTKAGQTVQAASIFKRLSPQGMLQYANKKVNRVNQVLEKDYGINAKKVKLTDNEAKKILQGMKEYSKMPEGDAKNIKIAQVMQIINDKTPSTIVDKTRALRNISLLGNIKTNVRNVVGNGIMGVTDNTANVVGTPIDKLISLKTGQRTTAIPNLAIQGRGFVKGTKNAVSDSFGGLTLKDLKGLTVKEKAAALMNGFVNPIDRNLSTGNGKWETGNKLQFKNKGLRAAENLTNTALKVGDESFKKAYYDDILNQLMKSNKVTAATDEMKAIAEQIAKERTYQDSNTLSQLGSAIKNAPQKIKSPGIRNIAQIAMDSQFPYVKTPLSLLKRAIEYTPEGLIEGGNILHSGLKNGNLDMAAQRQAVDKISRGIVGTGIMGLGALGAKKGILTGAPSKDKDKAAFDKQTGKQPYAIKMGNKYYNYDWAQPVSIPLSAGVQMTQGKKGGLNAANTIKDSMVNAANFYTEQPFLTNMQKLVGNQYGKSLGERVLDAGLSMPTQFIPTTSKQITQSTDKQVRSSYSPNSIMKGLVNPMLAKIPGASKTLQPKYDTLGRPIQQYQGNNNFGNVFLNPGNLTTDKSTPEEKFISELYDKTGDNKIFPRVMPYSITSNGKSINLTSKEYADFQKNVGEQTFNMLGLLKNEPLNDNTAQIIASLMTAIQNKERDKILSKRGIATDDEFDPLTTPFKKAQTKNNSSTKNTVLTQLGLK